MGDLLCTVLLASTTLYAVAGRSQAAVLFDDGEIVSKEYPTWFKLPPAGDGWPQCG